MRRCGLWSSCGLSLPTSDVRPAYPPIQRTNHPKPTPIHHMQIPLGGGYIAVPQQFLHGADVITLLKHACRKGVPKCMWPGMFVNPGRLHGCSHSPAHAVSVNMVPANDAGLRINRGLVTRKDELPFEAVTSIGELAAKGVGHPDRANAVGPILIVQAGSKSDLPVESALKTTGKHCYPVALAFSFPNNQLLHGKIQVFDSEPQCLTDPQSAAIHQLANQPDRVMKLLNDG